ncbi:hypothetical protein KEM56_005059 [Ascosphaera pollenicola]|nr:hypothetical protein KEM56_005059 [Ascosphaera pollenicola]
MKPVTRKNGAWTNDGRDGKKTPEPAPMPEPAPAIEPSEVTDLTKDNNEKEQEHSDEDLTEIVNALKTDAHIMENDMAEMEQQHATQLALMNAQLKQVQKERDDLLVSKQSTLLSKRHAEVPHPEEPETSRLRRSVSVEANPTLVHDADRPETRQVLPSQSDSDKSNNTSNAHHPSMTNQPTMPIRGDNRTLLQGFAPTTATGVPFVAPGVDVTALLAQRSTHRMRKDGDPANKMDGKNKREYKPWLRAVLLRISDNLPSLLYHSDQINYALLQLFSDLSSTMTNLVTARPDTTVPELIQEIENFMGICFLEQEARRALSDELVIHQKQGESVSTFFQRLMPYFQDADVPEMERIHKFYGGLRPIISCGLTGISFATVDALWAAAEQAKFNCAIIDGANPRRNTSSNTGASRNNPGNRKTSNEPPSTVTGPLLTPEQRAANAKLCPVVRQPTG